MFRRRATLSRAAFAASIVFSALSAFAQDRDRPPPLLDVFKRVVSDPTTYAPAIISAEAQHLDWKSSQVFFQHGFLEHNPAFTVSGRADDTPISYEAGNRRILRGAFATLGTSLVNNVTIGFLERALIERYPAHRTLVRGLGWTERIAFASLLAYRQSATNFRQWQQNGETAQ